MGTLSQNLTRIKDATDRIRVATGTVEETIENVASAVENIKPGMTVVKSFEEMRALPALDGDLCILDKSEFEPIKYRDENGRVYTYVDLYFPEYVEVDSWPEEGDTFYLRCVSSGDFIEGDIQYSLNSDGFPEYVKVHMKWSYNSMLNTSLEVNYSYNKSTNRFERGSINYGTGAGLTPEYFIDCSDGVVNLPVAIYLDTDSGYEDYAEFIGKFIKAPKLVPWERETFSDRLVVQTDVNLPERSSVISGKIVSDSKTGTVAYDSISYVLPTGNEIMQISGKDITSLDGPNLGKLDLGYDRNSQDNSLFPNKVGYEYENESLRYATIARFTADVPSSKHVVVKLAGNVSIKPDNQVSEDLFSSTIPLFFKTYYLKPMVYRYNAEEDRWMAYVK